MIRDYNDVLQLYNQNIAPSKIDYESYQPKHAWIPIDVIKQTFEKTTQFYRMLMKNILEEKIQITISGM